jgi:MFS family permease
MRPPRTTQLLASGPIPPFYSGLIFSAARLLPNSFSFAYLLSVGLTVQDVSLARFAQLIALVLFEVPAGVVADRLGSRAAITAATFSSLAWLTCMSVVSDLPTLVVAELANAASLSLFGGAFEILLRDSYSGQNPIARFTKTQSLWGAASSVLGTVLATAVSRQFAWAAAASIQGMLLLLLAYGLLKNRRSVPPRTTDSIVTLRALDAMRSFPLSLLVRVTLTTLSYTLILQFWQPLLILAGLPSDNNLLLLCVSLGSMIAMSAAGGYEEKRPSRLIPLAGVIVLAISMVLIGRGTHSVAATAMWVLAGIFIATACDVRSAVLLAETVRGEHEVALFSSTSAIARVVSGVAVFAYGSLVSRTDDLLLPVTCLAGLLIVASLVSRTVAAPATADTPAKDK